MTTTLAHQLAEYACALRYEDLSEAVVHEVKRRVIDSLGCALGAWNEEPCVIARNVASEFSAKNGATIIGTDHQAPPDWAAFATGCAIRYFDYNDTYLSKEPAHPSDNIAAALAVAESVGANGREFITAIALAYEVQCRLCDAASIRARGLGPRDLRRVFHGAGRSEVDEARSRKNAARGEHRGCRLCGDASGAGGRIIALERCGLRERGASWSLFGVAGARRDDRAGSDFRRPDGIRETAGRFAGRRWFEVCRPRKRRKPMALRR